MARLQIALLVIGVVLLAQAAPVAACKGKYKGGLKPSSSELAEILKQHAAWVKEGGPDNINDSKFAKDPRRANLCEADLNGAQLDSAQLSAAHLESAHLDRARLIGANLEYADLYNASLGGADLSGAHLKYAHLS